MRKWLTGVLALIAACSFATESARADVIASPLAGAKHFPFRAAPVAGAKTHATPSARAPVIGPDGRKYFPLEGVMPSSNTARRGNMKNLGAGQLPLPPKPLSREEKAEFMPGADHSRQILAIFADGE